MKTYLKLITAFLVFGLASANAQESNNQPSATTTKFESVEAATKAVVDSVSNDDKAATLALLTQACKDFPGSAADIVEALIKAIGQLNANNELIASRNVALGGNASDVNPLVVGEIVWTAINAAPDSETAIVTAALRVAPNATNQINVLSGNNPLIYTGLEGNNFNPASLPSTSNEDPDGSS